MWALRQYQVENNMDTHSELPPSDVFSEAMLAAINALKLIKDDPELQEAVKVLARNSTLQEAAREFSRIFRPDDPTPSKDIHKKIDNTPEEPIERDASSMTYSTRRRRR